MASSWINMDKDALKKYLLVYGYGRWQKIRAASAKQCKLLKDKVDAHMKAFADDFVRTLFLNL